MSYRNPQQNVDTQSGQAFANLQRTVAGAFGGIVQQEVAEQKELAKKQAKLAEKREKQIAADNLMESEIALGIKKYEVDNPALNIGESFGPLVDSYSDIMSTIRSGSVTDPKEIAKLRSQANDILTLPQRVGNMIESFSAVNTDIEETKSRAGKMGGLDLSTKSEMIEHMAVLMNEKPGKRETRIDYKDGKYSAVFVITPKDGKPQEYTEEQLRKYLSGEQQGAQIIPDETENMSALAESYLTVKDAATGKRVKSKSIYGNPTTRTIKANGQTIVETYRPLKRNGLIKGAMGMIKTNIGLMSENQKVSFMNNIVSPDNKEYDLTNINSKESIEALERGYGEHWLSKFTDGDQVLSTSVVKPEDSNKANSGAPYIQDIKKIQIPRLTRAESLNFDNYLDEGNVEGKAGLIDLDTYSKNLSDAGFLVTKAMSDASGRQMINVTFSREKGKNVTRTIYNDSSEKTVNKLLEEISGATDALNPN
jgi:hypothetical protein